MLVIFQLRDNLFVSFNISKRQNFSNENCTPVRIYMRTGFDIADLEVWRSIQLKILWTGQLFYPNGMLKVQLYHY